MWSISLKQSALVIYILIFFAISKILFINIYDVTGYVVDELYHIPQGLQYCNLNFSAWDPKITTLPGLYLISTVLMAPFDFCTVYGLRLTNFIASLVNIPLYVLLFHNEYDGSKKLSWPAVISGINLSILPPLYFFNHFYYTDVLSVTSFLIMLLLSKYNHHKSASLAGACSIVIRQTNVIWVAMIFGENLLKLFVILTSKLRRNKKYNTQLDFWNLYGCCRNFFKTGINLNKITAFNYIPLIPYLSVIIGFIIFVIFNGSIVVGDKSAHQATVHVPQLFYFSLFCFIFAMPHMIIEIIPFIKYVFKNKLLVFGFITTFTSIVHFNTIVHPYLLADNRHYVFYIWIRIYQKYFAAKYILTIVYLFSMYATFKRMNAIKNFGFLLVYICCTSLGLILQKLIEVRYFIIPFIILRLKFSTRNGVVLILEYCLYLFVNIVTFYIFFAKEIYWDDLEGTQRIMW